MVKEAVISCGADAERVKEIAWDRALAAGQECMWVLEIQADSSMARGHPLGASSFPPLLQCGCLFTLSSARMGPNGLCLCTAVTWGGLGNKTCPEKNNLLADSALCSLFQESNTHVLWSSNRKRSRQSVL